MRKCNFILVLLIFNNFILIPNIGFGQVSINLDNETPTLYKVTKEKPFKSNNNSLELKFKEKSDSLYKNVLYGNFKYASIIYFGFDANYERNIFTSDNHQFATFVKIKYGFTVSMNYSGSIYSANIILLTGRKHNLEIGLGLCNDVLDLQDIYGGITSYTYIDNEFPLDPNINIGYRYMKCDEHFIFRAGLGYPEFFYIGGGYFF